MRKVLLRSITVAGLLAAILLTIISIHVPTVHAAGTWSLTGSMSTVRTDHTATLLNNGKVLVAGGVDGSNNVLASAELYNPRTGTWSLTGSMQTPRTNFIARRLSNGEVLAAGGIDNYADPSLTSAELYNPATGTWSAIANMNVGRENFTATLLNNGEVLVAGGDNNNGQPYISPLASAELYNPTTGTWALTGSMHTARFNQTATLLTDGEVLVAGGDDGYGYDLKRNNPQSPCFCPHATATAELYNPATGTWKNIHQMHKAREGASAVSIPDGSDDILVAGGFQGNQYTGCCYYYKTAEIYNPTTGKWTLTGNMNTARADQTAAQLSAGQDIVIGGTNNKDGNLATAEIYDPTTGTWSYTGQMNYPRVGQTTTHLFNGQILVAGGYGQASAEIYTP